VTGSLPVLFFGDVLTAKAASVGLNPSKQEYLDPSGQELTGDKRRFETLGSLGCHDRSSLDEERCERAIAAMRAYFQRGKPVSGWFRPLARVMEAMGFSYQEGEVAHLDLVQEATDPTWSRLKSERPAEAHSLSSNDTAFGDGDSRSRPRVTADRDSATPGPTPRVVDSGTQVVW